MYALCEEGAARDIPLANLFLFHRAVKKKKKDCPRAQGMRTFIDKFPKNRDQA